MIEGLDVQVLHETGDQCTWVNYWSGVQELIGGGAIMGLLDGKTKHKQVVLAAIPKGMVKESDLRVEDAEIDLSVEPESGDVALKLLYIGVEPYYRELMADVDVLGFGLYQIGKVPFLSTFLAVISFSFLFTSLIPHCIRKRSSIFCSLLVISSKHLVSWWTINRKPLLGMCIF